MDDKEIQLELTVNIVTAFVGNNTVSALELPELISCTHKALSECLQSSLTNSNIAGKPAVPVDASIFSEYIICLEDGLKFKSLKRHLRAKYNLSPEDYRKKWGLPVTYPMVAPDYAKKRSELAKQIGLGRGKGSKG
ncbi:MAG: MucR family transcriptional regulator [Robiginitomaculum sp.]|nr:MucR family transcriptional regulator [Robiginitomaculum sp.]